MINNGSYICLPGRIVDYDKSKQVAHIKLCTIRTIQTSTENERLVEGAEISSVPVHNQQGGGWRITFDIKAGDDCLVMFSQRGYDHWFLDGKEQPDIVSGVPPHIDRCFGIQDAFCIVGFNPLTKPLENVKPGSEWSKGEQRIHLQEDGRILVKSEVDATLEAPTINLKGNVNVFGSMDIHNDLTSGTVTTHAGISLDNHIHVAQGATAPTTKPQ